MSISVNMHSLGRGTWPGVALTAASLSLPDHCLTIQPASQPALMHHHQHPKDDSAAVWAAARAVGTASQQLVAALTRASTAQEVGACVSTALSLFDGRSNLAAPECGISSSVHSSTLQEEELAAQAHAVGWPALRAFFYEDQFDTWACAVLAGAVPSPAKPWSGTCPAGTPRMPHMRCLYLFAVAAGEWLPQLQGANKDSLWDLIAATFAQCPAWNALSALLG